MNNKLVASMQSAASFCQAVSLLPAVATLDWADHAARCLVSLGEDVIGLIAVASLADDGTLSSLEAVGVSWGGASGAARASCRLITGATSASDNGTHSRQTNANDTDSWHHADRGHASGRSRSEVESAELTLRSHLDRLTHTELTINDRIRRQGAVGTLADWASLREELGTLSRGEADGRGGESLTELWEIVHVRRVAVGVIGLAPSVNNRCLISMVGLPGETVTNEETDEALGFAIAAQRVMLPHLAMRAVHALGTTPATSSRWLTSREEQVLHHLSLGKSVREIADELGRSPHTVHDHVKSLHRKLAASSRGELIARALGFAFNEEYQPHDALLPLDLAEELGVLRDDPPEVTTRSEVLHGAIERPVTTSVRSQTGDAPDEGGQGGKKQETAHTETTIRRGMARARPLRRDD